jgi:hypothetical protein
MAGKPTARIQVEGAVELRRALKRMGADLKDLTKINREAAEVVAGDARSNAPRLTGKLAGSIKGRATKTRATVTAGSRFIPYAGPIHFGWPARNISPQPFLYDAIDRRRDEVVRKYQERVGELVVRVGRETP